MELLKEYDTADFLKDETDIHFYLLALEDEDPKTVARGHDCVRRARDRIEKETIARDGFVHYGHW